MAIQFQHATLPNGLNVIAETDPDAHTSAVGFFVKTGSRDEDSAVMGVSHYLEHMMFKGTETRTAAEVDEQFDDIGADHNAFTTSEMTAFFAHCLPEHLERAEEILADILRPALRQEDFDAEKSVILEEIAMYRDYPFWALYEQAIEVYYGAHPLGHRVLGTEETVGELTRPQMADYFNDRYSADNTTIALAGPLDFDAAVKRLGERCGHWQRTDTQRRYPAAEPKEAEFTTRSEKVNRHYLLMAAPAPAFDDDRRYAAAMLAQILGDSEGSRLYWALIETGLAEEAQAHFDARDGVGDYVVYCSCSPEDGEKVEKIVRREMDALVGSLTEDDLLRVRSKIATGATLAGELPAGRMRRIGHIWTYLHEYRSLEEELARINAVTLDELRAVHEAFPIRPVVTGRLTPA
ncbi:MAG: insulinase family protein [Phycisphaerales bacterium]|nr:MAG: insulinase family protein [Phycisphaerales bacterium]